MWQAMLAWHVIAVAGIKYWSFLSNSTSIITKSINDRLPIIFLVDSITDRF
jgi:hypothetical protein